MILAVVVVGSHDGMGLREPRSAQLAYDQALDLNLDPPPDVNVTIGRATEEARERVTVKQQNDAERV